MPPSKTFGKLGWIEPKKRTRAVAESFEQLKAMQPLFGSVAAPIDGTGRGKTVLLHKVLEKVHGHFPVHLQTIGDCVSHGYGTAIDVLTAVEIELRGEAEVWPGVETATEWIYGCSRVIQGGGRIGNQDGSLGVWAQAAVKENGTLLRRQYGQFDLSTYDGSVAKDWGYRGLPRELEPTADEHPVTTTSLVDAYEEARDAIANGYPVPVCSDQGFDDRRDSQGFARPKGKWPHCMVFVAVDDTGERPGLLCINSWGPDWISGPKRHDQPEGSFWVDADVAHRMLQQGDSYALSDFEGYQDRAGKLDYTPF